MQLINPADPVVFLDFDGVLNSRTFLSGPSYDLTNNPFDPKAITRLNTLTDQTGARRVISSSWRMGRSTGELAHLLKTHEVSGRVIDCVRPRKTNAEARGDIVLEWLDTHPTVDAFVMLDDDARLGEFPPDRFIRTSFEEGLCDEHVQQAVGILM